ncbi:sensor domain-containing protein [Arenimonas sp.]|uniref:sensor domain-containing protein n=1 Tax=Arenimonas sp. TaxID=1872635 RepID=UPI002E33BC33|nr:EAL domain-containing protein [Arenimonas sp.]HEX4854311.1 EAL domain-containing protein [Arenimonas sp.]
MSGPVLPGVPGVAGIPEATGPDVPRLAEWFRGATHGALNAIYILEPLRAEDGAVGDFRFLFANPLGAELLRLGGYDLAGLTLRQAVPPSRVEIVLQQCRDVMASGKPLVEEFEVAEYPPAMRWLRHQVVPIHEGVVITSENISPRKQAEQELGQREEWFRAAAEGNLNALFINEAVFDAAGDVVDFVFAHVNEQGGRLVGMDPADMIGRSICDLFPVNRTHGYFEHYRQLFLDKRTVVDEFPIQSPTLKAKWLRQLAVPWSRGVALSAEDITEEIARKHALESRQRMLSAFLEQIPGPAWIADDQGVARLYNRRYVALGGDRVAADGEPVSLDALFGALQGSVYRLHNAELIATGQATRSFETGPLAEGGTALYDVYRFPIDADHERLAGGFALDITDRRRAEERAEYLISHDAATGLLNREGFIRRLAERLGVPGARPLVARISLREAETLREVLGSRFVDRLVQAYAGRMADALARHGAEVGRDGPDQMLLMLDQAEVAGPSLLAAWPALSREIALDDQRYSLNPRLGYVPADPSGATASAEDLLHACDLAHGQAVSRQTTAAIAYAPEMADRLQRRVEIQRELGNAIARDELTLVLQPVFADQSEGGVAGVEALVRWQSPRLGAVSPGEFIPIAEESSAIVALGDWVLEHTCRELRRLDAAGDGPRLYAAVNVAEAQLARSDFAASIAGLLQRHGLAPDRLELEITERTLMADTQVHQANLQALRALGVRLSVDDFGTGYSSLSYLLRFAVDKIKIDRSFVAGLGQHGSHDALVQAVVALADSLRLHCVAEGVETEDQLARLRALGCGQFQGYLLARPMAPAALRDWLAERQATVR